MLNIKTASLTLALLVAFAPLAHADKPPASAKKLNAAEIIGLYEGAYATFDNVKDKVKGDIFYSLKDKAMFGIYNLANGDRGIFRGTARVKGDQFCYKTNAKEVCQDVYLDGNTYYETNADGTITSIDTLLPNPPKLPVSASAVPASKILDMANGKTVLVTVFDSDKPLVARSKWDAKKSRVIGTFINGGKPEGKFTIKFKVKGDKICFVTQTEDCYSYHLVEKGFVEINDKGKVHAISTY
jgi:hypothetical protein